MGQKAGGLVHQWNFEKRDCLCSLDVPVDVAGDAAAGHGAVPELEVIPLRAVRVRRARRPEALNIILSLSGFSQFCDIISSHKTT